VQLADQSAWRPQCCGAIFDVAVYRFVDRSTWKLSCLQALEKRLMMKPKFAVGLLILVVCPLQLEASTLLRVIDGDSVIARIQGKQTKIRLACIDAPEIGQAPHGRIARNTLIGLLPSHSSIKVQPINYDQYGRLVANVFTLGGIDIGEELIRLGLVFVYQANESHCDGPKLLLIEDQARQSRIGIWKDAPQGITRPWLYR
jgi:endonuclease YncB( thermonuclease family)